MTIVASVTTDEITRLVRISGRMEKRPTRASTKLPIVGVNTRDGGKARTSDSLFRATTSAQKIGNAQRASIAVAQTVISALTRRSASPSPMSTCSTTVVTV